MDCLLFCCSKKRKKLKKTMLQELSSASGVRVKATRKIIDQNRLIIWLINMYSLKCLYNPFPSMQQIQISINDTMHRRQLIK
ncbi:MAG: hypothetical protein VR69_08565 [Peptococcaceae bacterium BRH_c4b]|nr:MAG: hypothetical protein VR69_08565 [Peptococcaceae bacterium BRH_c4b]